MADLTDRPQRPHCLLLGSGGRPLIDKRAARRLHAVTLLPRFAANERDPRLKAGRTQALCLFTTIVPGVLRQAENGMTDAANMRYVTQMRLRRCCIYSRSREG